MKPFEGDRPRLVPQKNLKEPPLASAKEQKPRRQDAPDNGRLPHFEVSYRFEPAPIQIFVGEKIEEILCRLDPLLEKELRNPRPHTRDKPDWNLCYVMGRPAWRERNWGSSR